MSSQSNPTGGVVLQDLCSSQSPLEDGQRDPRPPRRIGSTRFGKNAKKGPQGRKTGRLTRLEANNGVVRLVSNNVNGPSPTATPTPPKQPREPPRPTLSPHPAAGGGGGVRRQGAPPTADLLHADRFTVATAIGNGAFSNVFFGYDRRTRLPVAIKCIDKMPNFASSDRSEFTISSAVLHKHIIRCLGRYIGARMRQHLVFEFANQGDLFDELRSSDFQMPFSERKRYLLQTAMALEYLHSHNIVHFDIKLENILLHNGLVKVCDFGLSGLQDTLRRGKPHGTTSYMPPEYVAIATPETEYVVHCAADTWAFGIVIFAVAFADLPWEKASGQNEDYAEFKAWGKSIVRLEPFAYLGGAFRATLLSCLQADPVERMPMSEVVALLDGTDELVSEQFQDIVTS